MFTCALIWGGASLALRGLSTYFCPFFWEGLAVAGMADTWSVVGRATIIQSRIPGFTAGRISTREPVVGVGGLDLGSFRVCAVAALTGPGAAMAIEGPSCILASLIILGRVLALRRYELTEEPA